MNDIYNTDEGLERWYLSGETKGVISNMPTTLVTSVGRYPSLLNKQCRHNLGHKCWKIFLLPTEQCCHNLAHKCCSQLLKGAWGNFPTQLFQSCRKTFI